MGRGSRSKEDSSLTKPYNLREVVADLSGDGAGSNPSYEPKTSPCETARTLSFQYRPSGKVSPGDIAQIRLGTPPAIVVADTDIGQLPEPEARTIKACLLSGYRLSGEILALDPSTSTGEILITGKKAT